MALSFEESKKLLANQIAAAPMVAPVVADPGVMTLDSFDDSGLIAAYSEWAKSDKYDWYDEYTDDRISRVDEKKNISVDSSQINISQEENSQYIPFEMPRYYDGFDLMNSDLWFFYMSSDGIIGSTRAINVSYDTSTIRLGWLVDAKATHIAGDLSFEIRGIGVNSKGNAYVWKSKPFDGMTVLQSIIDDRIIELDDTWMQELATKVAESVADQIVKVEVADQIEAAQNAAERAETAANNAQNAITTALNNYYDKDDIHTYVKDQIDAIPEVDLSDYAQKDEIPTAISELTNDAGYLTEHQSLDDYATKKNLQDAIDAIDVTDQLGDYALKADIGDMNDAEGNARTVKQYVDDSVAAIDVSDQLGNLSDEEGNNRTVKQYVDDSVAAVDVSSQLVDYAKSADVYTKTEVDGKDAVLSSSISSLGATVGELQTTVNNIDTSPRLTYDVKYNDTEDADVGENVFAFYEITNEGKENESREIKQKFTIVGGSGGGATSSTLKIGYVTTSPLVITTNDKAIIKYTFSGTDSSGDAVTEGIATWKVAGTIVATGVALAGENEFDITDYITVGTQKVNLTIVDDAGSLVSKNWTVQKIDVRLESTFNDKLTYPIGAVSFTYTPYGAISKDVHFVLDGNEIGVVTTSASGIPTAYEIPVQTHGAHLLEAYITATINNNFIESNRINKDIIWYDATSTVPVIGTVYQNFTARQYDATNIEYTVYDPTTETPTVEIAVDGVVVSTPTLTESTNVYTFKTDVVGKHTITITCGETVKTLTANITKLDINVTPITAGLVFDFNPSGKSNNDADRVWTNGAVSMAVSDNFDWVNGGYQYDENGDQYFCIKAGTSATIDYKLFADDAKLNGKEFKFVFKTTNVARPDATFLHCMDNTTDSDHIGIKMDVQEAYIYGQAGSLHLPYSEEDVIEFEFNISKDTEPIPMVMGYEDGVSTRPMVYDSSYNFTQNTPKIISLGSDDCDLHIYRFKVYNVSLTELDEKAILNNFIADARNAEEMIARYERNQIYDENQNLDPDVLAEKCPWLRVYKLSAPYFTNNKSDKVPGTTIQQIYKNGDPVLDNWTCYDCSHSGQGTSSNNYGAAGRNLDFIMNNSQVEGVEPYFILGDGKTRATEITMTRKSVPTAYLNAKVNIASSNNMTNAMLANRYNEFEPYKRPFIRGEGEDTSFIKDTMEFNNCVIFIQETNEDLSTHREFADKNWHFYAIGNIGDSKKSDSSRLNDKNDPYEFCLEIMDVELPLSDFPRDTMMNAMGTYEDETTHEIIYIWAKDENLGILHELINGEYVLTQDTTVDYNKTYYVDILEHDDFSEDYTYGWRYISNKKDPAVVNYCHQKWIEFYRFVTTSTDEEFKAHIGDYMVLDSALYYYLFTTRYTMADNRAKNSFWHYGKTGEVDADGNPIRKFDLTWLYDADTSLGLNNYGKQVYRYGLEDTDVDEKGEFVFREADSTFFCRIRDLFPNELKSMYQTLESKNAWHAESFINQADAWQSEFPEELWRLDIKRKYLRTYTGSFINGKADSQFLVNMANGKMKYHRRQWERSQEKYMASKYQSSVASSDNSVLRCAKPTGDLAVKPNYRLKLTPYAYMYLNVKYGTQSPIQVKAEPNKEYEIPFEGTSADIIDIYSSSLLRSFGDLSPCYAATVDTSKASKIKELNIGNETPGYDNPYLTTLTTGANYLLEKLNVENVSGLTQALDLSALNNLRELYAHGSNIGGVTFSDGGRIEIAELPAINALTMKNLIYLATLDVVDWSKLTNMTVENCNTVDLVTILDNATSVNRIRLVGIDWALTEDDVVDNEVVLLNRLYAMKGFDKSGYNTEKSVLTGTVRVPIIREQKMREYKEAWPDLTIVPETANSVIEQFPVTFKNADGTVIEVQYVDKGGNAVDPTKRTENRIIPTMTSTVEYDFTFDRWDASLTGVFGERTINAIYTSSIRRYTIRYVSNGDILQESTGLYGENIPYVGSTPKYTALESNFTYHLFNRWDKSGFIDGDKTVNAIFDTFNYYEGAFDGKELSDMTPVEIYAMNKLGLASSVITDKDQYTIVVGNDVDYDDIESNLLISEKTHFNGTNYVDTGIKLFDEDKDFVLAIDYEFLSGNKSNSVLAQCFQVNGSNGFKLWYNNNVSFTWGTTSDDVSSINSREIIVIRHIKGNNNLMIYKSNLDGDTVLSTELIRTKTTSATSTLVFGAANPEVGYYENHAIGNINWAKIWYKDLGDDVCQSLAMWTHESITLEACGFRKYYLSDDPSKRCSFSMLASHLLGRTKKWNQTTNNDGGWANSSLNKSLNTRLYNAMPAQIKSLLKKVIVYSNDGIMGAEEIVSSDCYITIPALIEVSPSYTYEPYNSEGVTISYLSNDEARKRSFDGGDYNSYWLRTPTVGYSYYVWRVNESGQVTATQGVTSPSDSLGILIMISF